MQQESMLSVTYAWERSFALVSSKVKNGFFPSGSPNSQHFLAVHECSLYKTESLCVFYRQQQFTTQNFVVGINWQVKKIETRMSNGQMSVVDVHWLYCNLHMHKHTVADCFRE